MGGTEGRDGEVGVKGQLYLNIGLHNGVLLRTVVDQVIIIFFKYVYILTINIMSVSGSLKFYNDVFYSLV